MQVFQDTVAGIIANGILPRTASVVYAMYQMMRQKSVIVRDIVDLSTVSSKRIQDQAEDTGPRPASISILFNNEKSDRPSVDVSFANLSR